jgi:hypothetical protein
MIMAWSQDMQAFRIGRDFDDYLYESRWTARLGDLDLPWYLPTRQEVLV